MRRAGHTRHKLGPVYAYAPVQRGAPLAASARGSAGRARPARRHAQRVRSRMPSARARAQAEHGPAALPAGLGVRGRGGRGRAPGRARAAARGARAAPGAAGGVRSHGPRAGRHGAGAGARPAPARPRAPPWRLRRTAGRVQDAMVQAQARQGARPRSGPPAAAEDGGEAWRRPRAPRGVNRPRRLRRAVQGSTKALKGGLFAYRPQGYF